LGHILLPSRGVWEALWAHSPSSHGCLGGSLGTFSLLPWVSGRSFGHILLPSVGVWEALCATFPLLKAQGAYVPRYVPHARHPYYTTRYVHPVLHHPYTLRYTKKERTLRKEVPDTLRRGENSAQRGARHPKEERENSAQRGARHLKGEGELCAKRCQTP